MTDRTQRFDRVPQTGEGRDPPSRAAILSWWSDRFGIPPETFAAHSFWERGAGKIWVVSGSVDDPFESEGLGMTMLRTGGHDWKPTTNAVQRFGEAATRNVVGLTQTQAGRFVAGAEQSIDTTAARGYVIVTTQVAGKRTVLGVGQHLDGRLVSNVPKGRRRELLAGSASGSVSF